MSSDNDSTRGFQRVWAVFLLVFIAVTWRLWWPAGSPAYPLVPLLPLSEGAALGAARATSASLALALTVVAITTNQRRARIAWLVVSVALLIGFVADQHRLQPWAYQSALYAGLFASLPHTRVRRWMIPLAASIYLYSAVGKIDYQFAHTVGQDFLTTLLAPVGGVPDVWDTITRARVALLMPIAELTIGLGVLLPWTRRLAGVAAIGMHLTLIAMLGPWASDHSGGVLLWNALLIAQAHWLFVQRPVRDNEARTGDVVDDGDRSDQIAKAWVPVSLTSRALIIAACVMPCFDRAGYWDHWLSWSLYSPYTSRVDIELHRTAIDQLPETIKTHAKPDDDQDGWHVLSLGDWSLASRGVPVYPQARYQLAIADQLARRIESDRGIRVVVKGVSDRWTGVRQRAYLLGGDEIRQAVARPSPQPSPTKRGRGG